MKSFEQTTRDKYDDVTSTLLGAEHADPEILEEQIEANTLSPSDRTDAEELVVDLPSSFSPMSRDHRELRERKKYEILTDSLKRVATIASNIGAHQITRKEPVLARYVRGRISHPDKEFLHYFNNQVLEGIVMSLSQAISDQQLENVVVVDGEGNPVLNWDYSFGKDFTRDEISAEQDRLNALLEDPNSVILRVVEKPDGTSYDADISHWQTPTFSPTRFAGTIELVPKDDKLLTDGKEREIS